VRRLPSTGVAAAGLLVGLGLFAIFLFSYAGALHDPSPHHVPIGVLDARTAGRLDRSGGRFSPRLENDLPALKTAIKERKIAAGLVGDHLYVAGAASFTTASYLQAALAREIPQLRTVDLRPLPSGDSRAVTLFYASIAWVFGGYLAATIVTTLVSPSSPSHRTAALRVCGLAVFSAFAGLTGGLLLDQALGAITGHFLALAAIGALIAVAVAATTAALQSALGVAGTLVAMIAFVILGNSSSGGAYPLTFAPGFWRTIGPWLPTGAGVSALRGAIYFDGANITGRLLVLSGYALVGGVVTLALGRRRGLRAPELEAAVAAGSG
jgi:hypothetical protein